MSYSRWGESVWYTFWASCSAKHKEEELFEVCGEGTASYGEISQDIEAALDSVMKAAVLYWEKPPEASEREELKGYMLKFLDDVDYDYDLKS